MLHSATSATDPLHLVGVDICVIPKFFTASKDKPKNPMNKRLKMWKKKQKKFLS